MTNRRGRLGDLPQDIGTDHGQMYSGHPDTTRSPEVPGPGLGPGNQTPSGSIPGLARWMVNALVPYLFPSLKFSVRPFLAGVESEELSGSKSKRRYLLIQNNSASDMYINFGGDAVPGSALVLAAGGYYEPFRVPSDSISVSAASGSAAGILIEG